MADRGAKRRGMDDPFTTAEAAAALDCSEGALKQAVALYPTFTWLEGESKTAPRLWRAAFIRSAEAARRSGLGVKGALQRAAVDVGNA